MGSRDCRKRKSTAWVEANGKNASNGTFKDTAEYGDIILIAPKVNPDWKF
jgi:hypothetical protein